MSDSDPDATIARMIDEGFIRTLIDELVDRATSHVRIPRFFFGTTTDTSDLNNVRVVIDGDTSSVIVPSLVGPLYNGVRVCVMFSPPSGAMIIGYRYTGLIDQRGVSVWRSLGDPNSPASISIGGNTNDENVSIIVRNTDGVNMIFIGTEGDGSAFIRMMNPDQTAPVFEVSEGVGVFPLHTAAWTPNLANEIKSLIEPRPYHTGVLMSQLWTATLPLTTDQVRGFEFARNVDGGATVTMELRAEVQNTRAGHVSSGQIAIQTIAGLTGGTGLTFTDTQTIPSSIWTPSANPIGSLVRFTLYVQRTAGAGGVTAYSNRGGLWCI